MRAVPGSASVPDITFASVPGLCFLFWIILTSSRWLSALPLRGCTCLTRGGDQKLLELSQHLPPVTVTYFNDCSSWELIFFCFYVACLGSQTALTSWHPLVVCLVSVKWRGGKRRFVRCGILILGPMTVLLPRLHSTWH